ncbi:reverse transcriptase domain-containing protein [Tanacetum coccineum]
MTRISRTIMVKGKPFNMEHKINEYSPVKPIKQNKRGLGPDPNMAACKETEELTKVGILRKVMHQTWVANPVMVKKSDGGWKMCVDFTDINKACSKDCYPLPEIDWKIESFSGFHLKCFLDAYKGYHQIQMKKTKTKQPSTQEKESFATRRCRLVSKMQGQHTKAKNTKRHTKSQREASSPQPVLSKGAERSLAFFKVLKGCKDKKSIQWTTEADKALEKIKKLVQALPTLTAPRVGETLTVHLTASKESISDVLAAKRNEGWTPIYFVSRVLQGAELNYPALEKLVLALVHAARRLRRYFQSHTITVLINTPIKQMLTGPKKTGRVAKWAIELGEHDIVFLRRNEKETPADFLVEIPFEDNEKKEKPKEVTDLNSKWRLYTDEASNSDRSGAGLMLIDLKGKEHTYALRFEFETTNNEAEYEALLADKRTFAAKQTSIKDYLQKVKTALRGFEEYTVEHVRRNQNKKADALSKLSQNTWK